MEELKLLLKGEEIPIRRESLISTLKYIIELEDKVDELERKLALSRNVVNELLKDG